MAICYHHEYILLQELKDYTGKKDIMSLETIETELAALRTDVKNLTKIIRKIKNTQEDPDGEKARRLALPTTASTASKM
jgi:hypothetical protein